MANRVRRLLRVVLISVLKGGGLILREVTKRHPRILFILSLHLIQCKVLPLLGYDLLPLLAAHLFSHLDPLRLGIVDLGGQEGFRLRLLDDLDP